MDLLVTISNAKMKCHKSEDGTEGYVSALGVIFDNDGQLKDTDQEFFTSETYYGQHGGDGMDATLNHRIPIKTKSDDANIVLAANAKRRFKNPVKAERNDFGIIGNHVLDLRDEYERWVFEQAEKGAFAWSTGTLTHMFDKKTTGEITDWPIGEWAYTPTPAQPLNPKVLPIKSLSEINPTEDQDAEAAEESGAEDDGRVDQSTIEIVETNQMDENKETVEEQEVNPLQEQMDDLSAKFANVVELLEKAAPLRDAGYIAPDDEGTKKEVKSLGDFAIAIARGNTKRLQEVYGSVKAHDSLTGESLGYAVPEGFVLDINKQINLNSGISSLVDPQPVGQPSGRMPIPDYSVVPTAGSGDSAEAAGVGTNVRAEGGAYDEETGKLEQLQWRVTDALSGYVKASKELSQYAPAIEGLLRRYIATAQGSKKEYFILRGNGAGEPLGILNWTGAIAITPDTDNTFAVADADEMLSRFLQVGSQPVWLIHPGIIPDIAGMERGTGAGTFQSDISQALSTTLHGYPIIRSQHLPQDDNSGCVILADLSMYTMFEFGTMYLDFSEHADFLNGNNVWRFGQLVDGKPSMTSAVTLADPQGSYTLSPFVYLND